LRSLDQLKPEPLAFNAASGGRCTSCRIPGALDAPLLRRGRLREFMTKAVPGSWRLA
jgi:hypothetical protein